MTSQRHKVNPFLQNMTVPVKDRTVKLSRLGKDSNVLLNQGTGEVAGTHVCTYKKVDTESFVKLFSHNIALAFDLTSPGNKALCVVIFVVQHEALSKDEISLDQYALEDFLEHHKKIGRPKKLSLTTFKRGINDLEQNLILAKTIRKGRYFINPNFVFNGDRIAFTTIIERNGK